MNGRLLIGRAMLVRLVSEQTSHEELFGDEDWEAKEEDRVTASMKQKQQEGARLADAAAKKGSKAQQIAAIKAKVRVDSIDGAVAARRGTEHTVLPRSWPRSRRRTTPPPPRPAASAATVTAHTEAARAPPSQSLPPPPQPPQKCAGSGGRRLQRAVGQRAPRLQRCEYPCAQRHRRQYTFTSAPTHRFCRMR